MVRIRVVAAAAAAAAVKIKPAHHQESPEGEQRFGKSVDDGGHQRGEETYQNHANWNANLVPKVGWGRRWFLGTFYVVVVIIVVVVRGRRDAVVVVIVYCIISAALKALGGVLEGDATGGVVRIHMGLVPLVLL